MSNAKPPGATGILDPLPRPAQQQSEPVKPPHPPRKKTAKAPQPLLRQYESFLIPSLILFMFGHALAYALPGLPFAQPAIGLSISGLLLGLIIYTSGQGAPARRKIRLSLWVIALLAGSMAYRQFHFRAGPDDVGLLAPLERAEVAGTVETLSGPGRPVIRVKTVNGQPVSGQALAQLPDDQPSSTDDPASELQAGARVLITADLRRPFHSAVPGAFDQEKYLAGQQITALLKRPQRLLVFETSNAPRYVLQRVTDRLKTRVADTFSRHLPSPQAEVLGGLVLGDKAIPVDRDTRQAFIQTGLVHVLAASGLNVGIIAAAVLWLLTRLQWDYRGKLLAAMGAVAFYSLLTGLPPSIQRASLMLEIALILKLLNRSFSPALLLCVAGSMLLAMHPDHIGSIGFQFSMLTTFGLVTMVPPLQEKLGYYITRGLAGLVLVPMVAQLWVWPLSVFYFNQFPVHAIPLNLLAILLVTPLTLIGFTAAALSILLPPLGGWLSWLAVPFLNGLLALVQWGDSLSWAQWTLPSPAPGLLTLLYAQLFVLLWVISSRSKNMPLVQKALVALLPVVAMLGLLCAQKAGARGETQVALLPLSFRHEGYLIKPAGQDRYLAVLPARLSYFESRAVADYLKHRNIAALEALVLLPEPPQTEPISGSATRSMFRVLRKTSFHNIITTPDIARDLETPQRIRLFPASGARIQFGNLALLAQFPQLQLVSNQRCLLEITDRYRSDSRCGIQAVQDAAGLPRFFSTVSLDGKQYYELRQQEQQFTVY